MKAGSKVMRDLQRSLAPGLVLEPDGKSKARIRNTATGELLRHEDGRAVGVPCSPRTKGHSYQNVIARLRKVGALCEGK